MKLESFWKMFLLQACQIPSGNQSLIMELCKSTKRNKRLPLDKVEKLTTFVIKHSLDQCNVHSSHVSRLGL